MRKTFLLIFALCATMMAWGETTVTRTVKDDLATEYGWVNKTSKPYNVYQSFYLDGNISVVANSATSTTTTSNDVNGIYSSPRWFVYQSDNKGSFTISAANGYVIKSVKLKYFTADNGVLSLKDDASTAAADQIASGAVVDVNKPSVTFYTGKSATGTRPRIGIESFEVTYEKGGIVETYLDWNFGAPSTETEKVGALGTWKVIYTNAGQAQDTLADGKRTQAVGLYTRAGSSSPYTLTQGQIISPAIEGGIKYVSFRWNQMYTGTNTFSISCQATGKEAQSASFTGTSSNKVDKIFTYSPAVKNNTSTITIKNANTNASNNARLVVGPITIVPYLLFTQKTAEVNALEQNSYTYPADKLINNTEDGTVTYSIKSNSGATINAATGEVNLTTVTSAATDTITATWGEVTTTYSLTISYTAPAEGTYWKEGFSNFKAEGYTGYTTDIAGDYGIVWIARNFRHKTSDNSDKVDGEYGVRLNYAAKDANKDGYIETNSLEGGVKRLQFKWKTPSNSENPKFTVELDGETAYTVDQPQTKEQSGTVYNFGYNANIAKNAKFTIRVTNGTCASIFGPLTIVPYLYYKTKSHTIENATEGATYTNPDLINNIDEGAITYSLIGEGADDIASIDTDGKVTVKAGGVVTVQAKWVPEGAEEDEFVTTTYELTINFPQPTITFNNIEVALDGTVTPDITVVLNEEDITETATISYEVADENIATWDATNGWKLKTNGTTQVTAKVERTAQYGAASATATMTVNTMTFAEGTFFTENFGGEATSGYSTKAENWRGKDNVYPWTFLNWRRYADHVRITMTKPGSSNINGYIYMNPSFDGGALEGGIKAVQVTWSAPGASSLATDFYVDDMKHSDATKVTIKKEAGASTAQQITQAIFNSKTNDAQLRIRIGSLDKSAIDVYSVDIVPYLLYTKKEVPVTYELEGTNTVDASDNLINNLEEDETVTYTLSDGAQASIDGSTITLANVNEDVIVTAKCGDVSTTFTLKVTKAAELTRDDLSSGQLITVCLDKNITSVEGGTFYQIDNGTTSMITFAEFAEEDFPIAKATPLLFQSDGTEMKVYCGTDQVAYDKIEDIVEYRAMKGIVNTATTEQTPIAVGNIIVSGGQLHLVGGNCVFTPGHAYIDVTKLPQLEPLQPTPSCAPRRTMTLYNPDAAPTNLNGLNGTVKPMKVLRDGQFYIIRETKTYNAQGVLVE